MSRRQGPYRLLCLAGGIVTFLMTEMMITKIGSRVGWFGRSEEGDGQRRSAPAAAAAAPSARAGAVVASDAGVGVGGAVAATPQPRPSLQAVRAAVLHSHVVKSV